nr:MAG TPA: hypothetical protein [Caudoviricetes sp.]
MRRGNLCNLLKKRFPLLLFVQKGVSTFLTQNRGLQTH